MSKETLPHNGRVAKNLWPYLIHHSMIDSWIILDRDIFEISVCVRQIERIFLLQSRLMINKKIIPFLDLTKTILKDRRKKNCPWYKTLK